MGGCCVSRGVSSNIELELSKYIDCSGANKIPDQVLLNLLEHDESEVICEKEFIQFAKKFNLSMPYKSLCKEKVMLKRELIMAILFMTTPVTDLRLKIAGLVIDDDPRKLMNMIEWKYQLLYKNIPEEICSRNEGLEVYIRKEMKKQRAIVGRLASHIFKLIQSKDYDYKLLIS